MRPRTVVVDVTVRIWQAWICGRRVRTGDADCRMTRTDPDSI